MFFFRLIDTAGIRSSKGDVIEDIGIERSKANAEKADLIIHLESLVEDNVEESFDWLKPYAEKIIDVYNKADEWEAEILRLGLLVETQDHSKLYISAKKGRELLPLKKGFLKG